MKNLRPKIGKHFSKGKKALYGFRQKMALGKIMFDA